MSEVEELRVHIEALETHVARLEGIIHVMLECGGIYGGIYKILTRLNVFNTIG